jgi:CDP-diacylglycerol---serine O-phosphatidyltransferase
MLDSGPMGARRIAAALPNLFTLAALFCGFYAIARSFGASTTEDLYAAALAILFGAFFDAFDGRVARLTRTESALGLELDSLSDVVTFGVAPASLLYNWGLAELGLAGLLICFAWIAAGALRLARFNVLAQREEGKPGPFIVGLPIPAAATFVVSLVVLAHHAGDGLAAPAWGSLAVITLVLSLLMVSRFRFRSFKAIQWRSRRTFGAVVLLVLSSIAVWIRLQGAYVFVGLIPLYIGLGVAETLLRRSVRDDAARQGL